MTKIYALTRSAAGRPLFVSVWMNNAALVTPEFTSWLQSLQRNIERFNVTDIYGYELCRLHST